MQIKNICFKTSPCFRDYNNYKKIIKNMGLKALVDYAVIKELCDKIKKDPKSFTGKVKGKFDKNAGPTDTVEKVNEVKRLLLSSKRKHKAKKKSGKKSRQGGTVREINAASEISAEEQKQRSGSSGSSGDSGTSDESGSSSESADSGDSDSDGTGEQGGNTK